jgi:hypothetical protein
MAWQWYNFTPMKKHSFSLTLLLCALVFTACVCAPVSAAELGRLFMTPQKRLELDEARKKGELEIDVDSTPVTEVEQIPNFIRFDGLVLRSNGQHSAWFNGQHELPPGVRLSFSQRQQLAVPIFIVNSGLQVLLKPGQSLDTVTGAKIENYLPLPKSTPAESAPEKAAQSPSALTAEGD